MRRIIIALSLIGSLVIFLLSSDFIDTAIMLLLFGVLPGRAQPLSANLMLTIYIAFGLIIAAHTLRHTVHRYIRRVWQSALTTRSKTA